MNKKYIEVSRAVVKICRVAILSFSFFLLSVGDVNAAVEGTWKEQISIDSPQIEFVEYEPSQIHFELLPTTETVATTTPNDTFCNLHVESPYQEEFEMIKRELSILPITEAIAVYMESDPGFFFKLKLKDNIQMTVSRYIDPEDEDAYVNIWKDEVLTIQDYMPLSHLTEILLSHYAAIV